MNILFAASEAFPYAKSGGLADIMHSLPKALAEAGHKVSVVLPYYPQIMKELCGKLKVRYDQFDVQLGDTLEKTRIYEDRINKKLTYYFVEYNRFYDRPKLYDWAGEEYADNAERYIFLCRATMDLAIALNLKLDILHTNDWHTSLCNVYLKSDLYSGNANFAKCKSVVTIHNIGYQGIFDKANLYWTGLGWEYFNHTCLEYNGCLNFLNAGILTADMVSTVSPTYAKEILTHEFAFNLEGSLAHVADRNKLKGIINCIDTYEWNPEIDPLIPANYTLKSLAGKKKCKKALQKKFGLPQKAKTPIFGIVSRLATQKGIDIFCDAIWSMLEQDDCQFVILGSGEQWLHDRLDFLAKSFPKKIGVYMGYDNKLAHMVEAGVDMFVMPSRYEPCGLNQMYSMRYGTVPVVRATGGLEDTVENYDPKTIDSSTGFKFNLLTVDALLNTLRWAEAIYATRPDHFSQMMENGMKQDFSAKHMAKEYEQMYLEI